MELGGQVVLWTCDGAFSEVRLTEKCPEYLKSDILQIPHHGYNGGTVEFYKSVKAPTIIYTNNLEGYRANKNKNAGDIAHSYAKQVLVPTDEKDIIAVELPYQASYGTKWNRK